MTYHLYIGRWCPFHNGHAEMILQKPEPYLILIRDTPYDFLPADVRAESIMRWLAANDLEGLVMVIPDIEGVYYGRGVGYAVEELEDVDNPVSGTAIRESLNSGGSEWRGMVPETTAGVISEWYGLR